MGRPLQGPEAVKEKDIQGDEDDEAGGRVRGQKSGYRHSHKLGTHTTLEGVPRLPPFSEEEAKTQRVRDMPGVTPSISNKVSIQTQACLKPTSFATMPGAWSREKGLPLEVRHKVKGCRMQGPTSHRS